MAITYIGGNTSPNPTTNNAVRVLTLPSAVPSGGLVCGCITWDDASAATLSLTDDKNNTYNFKTKLDNGNLSQFCQFFWLGNITNGPSTLTATWSANLGFNLFAADVFTGIAALTDPSDGYSVNSTVASSVTQQTSNITTTINGDLIYAAFIMEESGGGGAASPETTPVAFTTAESLPFTGNPVPIFTEYAIQSSAGAINATCTIPSAGAFTGFGMGFQAIPVPLKFDTTTPAFLNLYWT